MVTVPREHQEAWGLDADGKPPPLHPDLADHVYVDDHLGAVLKHPLVFQVPYDPILAGMANRQYNAKVEALDDAIETKNWYLYLFLHERPYRVDAFERMCWRFTNREYWTLLSDVWTDTENLWQNAGLWEELLTCDRRDRRKHFMTDEERAFLADVGGPDAKTLTVYRGTSAPDGMGAGLSWTLDRQRAEWFAQRFSHKGTPRVIVGEVPKRRVIAYLDGRNESEIIALPAHVRQIDDGEQNDSALTLEPA